VGQQPAQHKIEGNAQIYRQQLQTIQRRREAGSKLSVGLPGLRAPCAMRGAFLEPRDGPFIAVQEMLSANNTCRTSNPGMVNRLLYIKALPSLPQDVFRSAHPRRSLRGKL
jgi:hypothetical protein